MRTTNEEIDYLTAQINDLIGYAEADAQHSLESDAPIQAKDDARRAKTLRKIMSMLDDCRR